jgi:hypothetical protein
MPSLTGDALLSAQGLGLDYTVGAAQNAFKEVNKLTAKYDVFERRNAGLAESFNLSVLRAAELGDQLDKLAKDFDLGGDAMRQLTIDLKGLIGPFATLNDLATTDFGKKLIKSSALLRNNYGLSADSANKLIRATQKQGKDLDIEIGKRIKITDHIEAALGGIELTSETLDDVANLSADLQLQYGKMPGMLELSVIKAKQLGISMQQLHTTGKNLLNIETSIGQEMEYQLLSGRRLVDNNGESLTNQYRMAVMQKNSSKQASIMFELLQKEGKTLNENFLAREKMAELLGMDEATLSTMLQKYEAIQDLPGAARLFGLTGDALLSELKTLTTDAATIAAAATAGDQRSTETILESLEDKLTTGGIQAILKETGESGASIAGAQRRTRISAGTGADGTLSAGMKGAYIGSAAGVALSVGSDLASLAGIVANAFLDVLGGGKTISKTNPIPVAVVGTAGLTTGNDFASFGGGNRMLLGPEGAMSINNNDLVLGGTSLFGNKNSGGDIMQFAAAVVAAINNQTRELKSDPVFGQGLSNSYYG